MSEDWLRRLAELGLIGIAAVWGLTFVMVQDAIALLPTMAFLAYRFIPAALIVALVFWRPLRSLPAAGWRAGLVMGVFAQQHAPPARTALILASEPAFAGLFGWLLNDERLTATGWLGAGLIMAAIVAVEVAPRLRPPRPLPEG
jgi:drug/metabolite transporter (DMT)-like permease